MIYRSTITCFFLLLLCNVCIGQESPRIDTLWATLYSGTSFEKVYNADFGFEIDQVIFSEDIKKLDGQEITISGYKFAAGGDISPYPVSNGNHHSSVSRTDNLPIFVVFKKLHGKNDREVFKFWEKLPEYTSVKGKLKLNADDGMLPCFILEEAEAINR